MRQVLNNIMVTILRQDRKNQNHLKIYVFFEKSCKIDFPNTKNGQTEEIPPDKFEAPDLKLTKNHKKTQK